jgi:hypothetical protein
LLLVRKVLKVARLMIRKGSLLLIRKCSHLLVVLKVALLLCLETVGCWVSKVSLKVARVLLLALVARVLLLALVGVGSLLLLARLLWLWRFCFKELSTLLCDGWLAYLSTLCSLIVLLKVQKLL